MVVDLLTAVGVLASLALAAGMVASHRTGLRFWPPGSRDWRWWAYIGLGGAATVSLLGVAFFNWNGHVLPRPETLVAGGVLVAVGVVGFLVATFDLGVKESSGMEGELRTGGFYRYTRNPQIVFLLCIIGGLVLAAGSPSVAVVGASMVSWFVSMPFAEETWLREEYGEAYEAYRQRVPRFIGRQSVRALLGGAE